MHQWIQLDYKDGWIGLRVEPEDQARATAIKEAIPAEERKYLSSQRKWIFKPKWSATVVRILEVHCQDFPVILEEKHADLLQTLLMGPSELRRVASAPQHQPEGRHVGTIEDLGWG